jgi:hypothetical protein
MRNHLIKSIVAAICLSMVLIPAEVTAQNSSDVGMSIRVNPSTINPGGTVGVFGLVTNNTSSKMRTAVTITSMSSCGTETVLGSGRLTLNPGQTIQVTVSYPLAPDACVGTYTVSITARSPGGGKNSTASADASASAFLVVQ